MIGTRTMPVADRVRTLRDDKGLTQMQLAVAAGMSLSLVAKIEQGETPDPRWSTMRKLARALGVPLDALADPADPDA
jgi:transcriptional regulator with XRE-family HTH domain